MSDWFDLPDPVIAALRAKLQEAEVEKDQLRMDRDRLQSQVDICYYKDSVKEIARLQAEVSRLKRNKQPKEIPDSGGHIESADCWCEPTVEEHDGGTLIIHNQTH